ncbi:5'-methylthioadenosine/adenosylhomocysteine nucleosidase [Lacticaseibacillus nasuensis]|uniref:5'-methylthioadenosine/adenosylhomocysteine nucleosidase n=1 Tax=Lacticaseibacillus nasuensis TaxID=944671 RepID=UPI000AF8652A|nr:5'-methylthioadenosine/adenosylhomocysteine nucleosidase [Lacticaseibacillus nasuensis]
MKLAIICAMEEELRELRQAFSGETETVIGSQHYFAGTLNDVPVVLVESGIGKVQAGATAAVLIAQFAPTALINTGSAGGIGTGLAVGEVVVSTAVAYHDVDATAFGYAPGQLPGQPARFAADAALVASIQAAATAVGLTNRTVDRQRRHLRAQRGANRGDQGHLSRRLASEMEGAAVGQVATQFHVPFVVIRAMSDNGDDTANVDFDEFIVAAGRRSAAMVLALTQHMSKEGNL